MFYDNFINNYVFIMIIIKHLRMKDDEDNNL